MNINIKNLKTMFMNQGLRIRLGILFALVSLVPLLTLGFFSYYKSSETIKDIASRYSTDITNEINTNMLLRFKNITEIGKILLNNNTVKEILSKKEEALQDFKSDNSQMSLLLKTISDSNENIRSVYILSSKNTNIFAFGNVTEERGLVFFNDEYRQNYKDSELYKETIKANKKSIWWPTQNVLGNNVFILTEKLYDEREGVLGILVIHLGIEIMDEVYSSAKIGKDSKMYLMDENGRILFHPNKSYIGKQINNNTILAGVRDKEEANFIIKENNKPMFVVYNTFSVTHWKSVVITYYNDLISDAEKIRYATLIISITCLILIILFSIFLTKGILNPIYKLMRLMKQGATGDMKVRFNTKYNDEIGQLGDSFNKMMSDIEKLVKMVEDESNKKIEAEIKVLEAHINPHFLYNTLASIYWNAMANGNTEIGKMSASLSKFFKLGLNKGKGLTTVGKEVEHVREFLSIQKILYKSVFDYQIYICPEIQNYKTIKLILQPLVENSLVHGMKDMKENGFINIEVTKKEERILFKVTDNGTGLKEQDIQSIIDSGYGLKNIKERLRLYFNNDFTMVCSSIPNQATTFEITIPAIPFEEVSESVQTANCR